MALQESIQVNFTLTGEGFELLALAVKENEKLRAEIASLKQSLTALENAQRADESEHWEHA